MTLKCHISRISYCGKFVHFCVIVWRHGSLCRRFFGNLPPPQIKGTCDIPARCCCSGLNLGDKRTYFTDQVFHPEKHYVREFRHYYICLYCNCNFPERQTLSNSKTPHKPNSSPASSAE